jgi:hypothetical protein
MNLSSNHDVSNIFHMYEVLDAQLDWRSQLVSGWRLAVIDCRLHRQMEASMLPSAACKAL